MINTKEWSQRILGDMAQCPKNTWVEFLANELEVIEEISFANIKHPLWQSEFHDIVKVLEMGAKKYKVDGWLDTDGHGTSHKEMHDSMFHHLAQSYSGLDNDYESNLDHLLHVATRALMLYTRKQRGIHNPKDVTFAEENA